MSRGNRRKRPVTQPPVTAPAGGAAARRSRPSLLRREVVRIDNEPGYANPGPWSLRSTLILYAVMMAINVPVTLLSMRLENAPSYADALVTVSPFLYLLYALLAVSPAQRLSGEPRRLRPLETLSAGALMYLLYVLATGLALEVSGHGIDPYDAKQMAGAVVAGLIGGAVGALLYPIVHRKLWMHRLPSSRRGPRP
jgi:hypothetical protein